MAATTKRTQVADLKQQVDAGITRHLAMSRELPNWLDEYKTKEIDLENVMNETTICTRRAWIREKIRVMEDLYEKINLTWDLKGEQLVTLTQILHHENYTNTALKDFLENDKECEEVLKSLGHYIQLANETHVEEGNKIDINKQELDDKLEWWRTQACDCIWTEWGSWSECTKTCGEGENAGTTKRKREVSQLALNNGTCSGLCEESKKCNIVCCPVDCTWNQWSEWTKCEEKCPVSEEDGKVHRYRSKNEHQCGGAFCQGGSKETKSCHIISIMQDEIKGLQDDIAECNSNTTALYYKLCDLLDCQNGGVCHEGVCICQPGYHGTSCEKLPVYQPDGPQVDILVATLTGRGWTQCHKELYSYLLDNNQFEEIGEKCHGEKVFVGCKRVGSDLLTVAAWGRKATVFTDVTDENETCSTICNSKKEAGTQWYRTPKAWGFAAQDDDLYLSFADIGDTHGPAPQNGTAKTRLSWYINRSNHGGYRCGADKHLYRSKDWEMVFFHAN